MREGEMRGRGSEWNRSGDGSSVPSLRDRRTAEGCICFISGTTV